MDAARRSDGPTVLRPSWVSTLSVPIVVAVVVVLLAVLGDADPGFPAVFIVVFTGLYLIFNRRRVLELGPTSAVRRGTPTTTTMARAEVRSVASGPWWRGGLILQGAQRSLWCPVGDLPLGYVSAERLRIVRQWALREGTDEQR